MDVLGVVHVGVAPTGTALARNTRQELAILFGDDGALLQAKVRHAEATATAARDEGLLVHELDEHRRRGPKWYQILGKEDGTRLAPRSSESVADDLKDVTQEIVDRLTAAESRTVATG